jgi:Tol biopolymer transport system component
MMIGQSLSHYRVLEKLGAGGMGEVWLAEDTTLKRKVALKVLPAGVATDPDPSRASGSSRARSRDDRLARFQREAEAVAALSHPNIVTIYSIEQDGDVRFLTMERVEGQSLDQVIPRGGLPLGQVLEIGATLADALAASHEKGIIHRDLKPANIMLAGRERRVKVLDFGLAKLREEAAADGETTTAALSGEGRILGTVAYMSPEQAEGKPVDARSDLFSLGIVLYELATGERPFKGDTSISVLSAILRDTPKSVTDLRADLPRELGRIIRQCLQKDPEERYQTAKDLRNQLRALKAGLDSGEIAAVNPSDRNAPVPRRRRLVRWLAIGAGALTFVAITAVVAQRVGMFSRVPPSRPFESIRLKQLTDTGKVAMGAISPDGRYIVYSVMDGAFGRQSLWLRQTATGSDVLIIPPSDRYYFDMTFSPDGSFVYYTTLTGPGTGALYQIPALGGAERRVLDDVVRVSVSPDGARLAAVRNNVAAGEASVLVANPDGTGERRLVTRKRPDAYQNVAWSPDGRTIATLVLNRTSSAIHIVLIDPESGKERDLGAPGFTVYGYGLAWLPEGFLLTGAEPSTAATNYSQVWMVAYPGGEARRITHDLNLYSQLSATADGRTIVADQDSHRANIWTLSLDDPQAARQITFGRRAMDGSDGLDWAPDGRLVYASFASGSEDVWSMKSDGSQPRQLTFNAGLDMGPAVSTDGRFIVFFSDRSGVRTLWRMDIDGGNARQLTSVRVLPSLRPVLTPDGTWVVYSQVDPGTGIVTNRKVPVDGGESVPLFKSAAQPADSGATAPPANFRALAVSADGRWVAGGYMEANRFARWRFVLVSAEGTEPRRELSAMPSTTVSALVRGTRDGRALLYVRTERGVSNLWLQPLDGGAPRQLTSFASGEIYSFALSDDGRTLAVSRGEATTDLVMITSEDKK